MYVYFYFVNGMSYYEWGISFLLIIDTYENGEKFEKNKRCCVYVYI